MPGYSAIIRSVRYNGTLPELSETYSRVRDESGEGCSTFPTAVVFQDGVAEQIGFISYNGRIWSGTTYQRDAMPIYDNREEAIRVGTIEALLGAVLPKPFGV